MGFFRYYRRVLRVAFTHSLDIAQAAIFVSVILIGAAAYLLPLFGMPIDLRRWIEALTGWQVAAGVFGTIVAVRLVLAPYWIHQELEQTRASVDKRKAARAQLQKFYVELGQLLSEKLSKDISAEDFKKYADRVEAWGNGAIDWIGTNLGAAAQARFLDKSNRFAAHFSGAVNDEHNNLILILNSLQKNLSALIESDAWDV